VASIRLRKGISMSYDPELRRLLSTQYQFRTLFKQMTSEQLTDYAIMMTNEANPKHIHPAWYMRGKYHGANSSRQEQRPASGIW